MYRENIPNNFIPKYAICDEDILFYRIRANNKIILSIDMRFIVELEPPFYKNDKKYWNLGCKRFLTQLPENVEIIFYGLEKLEIEYEKKGEKSMAKYLQWDHYDFFDNNIPKMKMEKNNNYEEMTNIFLCPFDGISEGFYILSPDNNDLLKIKVNLHKIIIEDFPNLLKITDKLWFYPFNKTIDLDEYFQFIIRIRCLCTIVNQIKIYCIATRKNNMQYA